ncbi:MAG: hypothetical protein DMF63_06050 [Acidobacteria bacterium]|nr:MAG: hypothetical protein DMF63_06050 [Acidobacteriota bacterium]
MQNSSLSGTRRGLLLTLFVLGVVTALILVPSQFRSEAGAKKGQGLLQRTVSQEDGIPKMWDIREDGKSDTDSFARFRQSVGRDASAVADVRDGFVRGEAELKARLPHAKVEYNNDIRIPEVITPNVASSRIEFLSPPSGEKRSEILRSFVKEYSSLIGVNSSQADSLKVAADYTNPDGNMSYAHLEQRINDVKVFRGEVKAGFTQDGRIVRVINNLAPGLNYESLSKDFGNPVDAVRVAAQHVKQDLRPSDVARNDAESKDDFVVFGTGDSATTAEKMYFPMEPGVAVPSWRVLIYKQVAAYYVIVDAASGVVLWHKNIVDDQTQSATYDVYANPSATFNLADNPAPLSPYISAPVNDPTVGAQGALITRSSVTRIGNEAPYTFNNNGWITDGANITDGNANEAGLDLTAPDGVDAPETGVPNRVFNSGWNPPPGNPAPGDAPTVPAARRGAVIQMFYAMNLYHDELYRYGFTEQARNFQASNFGRGGAENDRVRSEGQDSSGTDNANFLTPADGGRGRMQMYVWTGPTPDRDGTGDAEVIFHEVTHGTSNRLHGDGSGLGNQGSMMGEGWGDWYAEALLSQASDGVAGIHTTGGYATQLIAAGFQANYYYGIRRFPRAPLTTVGGPNRPACNNLPCPHNPLSFRHINTGCDTEIGTTATANISAFPRGPIGTTGSCSQVHNAGEVWSSALWEVRSIMVTRLGWAAGNPRIMQLVLDGMKLAPINPTMIQERDAIIAAAAALPAVPEASADVADIREGFRRRGMGFSASVQAPGAVTEAFDFANVAIVNPFSVSDSSGDNDGYPEPGENVLLSVTIGNSTGASVGGVMVNVNGGTNVNYGTITDGQTVKMNIPYTVPAGALCGSLHTVTINVTSNAGAQAPVMKSFRLGVPTFGASSQNFDGVTAPALPGGFENVLLSGTGINWTTSATGPSSAPNSAFANDPATLNDAALTTVAKITSATASIAFKNKFTTESTFDGAVLEYSTDGGGSWTDVCPSCASICPGAGCPFVSGGYTQLISTGFSSPIGGRRAWSGAQAAYLDTVVNLPAALNGQTIGLRWRMVSDVSVASTGINIDDIVLTGGQFLDSFTCNVGPTAVRSRADFDGDGKTDLSVFRPSEGNWYLNRSMAGFGVVNWGLATDALVPGDYDGDGKADTAVFRPDANPANPDYLVLNSNGFVYNGVSWGVPGDVAVNGNYDGDTKTDFAVFRPSNNTWYVLNAGGAAVTPFGATGDIPLAIDNNGDGKTNYATYRPSNTTFYIARATGTPATNFDAFPFGTAGDVIAPADYDGDNKEDVAVFRPSNGTWYIQRSSNGTTAAIPFGSMGDVPVPGDYDGDGTDDVAVYRGGTWYVNRSTSGLLVVPFGLAADVPIPVKYLPGAPSGGGGGATTVSYSGAAVPIPDNLPAGVNVNLLVAGAGTIADLNFSLDGTAGSPDPAPTTTGVSHSWVGDLIIKLTSPMGTTVTVFDRPGGTGTALGCSNNNLFNVVLNDDGGLPSIENTGNPTSTTCNTALAFPTGSFSPNNALSAFDGQNADGTWVINFSDNAAVDTGNVRAFSLRFNSGN